MTISSGSLVCDKQQSIASRKRAGLSQVGMHTLTLLFDSVNYSYLDINEH
jgi:hypothetical protein